METNFERQRALLLIQTRKLSHTFHKASHMASKLEVTMPEGFERNFFALIDSVNLRLMEDKDNFYGYFVFQMARELRFDINSPTAVNFKGAQYVIYFNPLLFLELNLKQMETCIKHEILHILSMHLIRAKALKKRYSTLVINIAMDLVINKYLDFLPPYAITLDMVNKNYNLNLEPFAPFEHYADKLQTILPLMEQENTVSNKNNEGIATDFSALTTHDLWDKSSSLDEKTLQEFTKKAVTAAEKGELPSYIKSLISSLKNSNSELPWNLYLKRLMGTVESNMKKTVTRRSRRQPERLDLRGQLRSHKANVVVAIDISGSISKEEFYQSLKEVLGIVKNYNNQITVLECDNEIRREYTVKTVKDMKDRISTRGSTKFNPVFEYANQNKVNLLIYFTDGKGETQLKTVPRGYQVLWVITGKGEQLSLKQPYGIVKKLSNVEIKDTILDQLDVKSGGFSMQFQERNI
ncbi:MAG: VWA-like domain-containing protein [Mobilitalea sp.]